MALFKRKANRSQRKLEEILAGAEVPAMSRVVLDILQKLRDPEASMREIAEMIQWDPGLVTRIFRTVNSSAYGISRPIDDVRHAATFLGRTQLEQLVLGLAVRDALPKKTAPGFQVQRYWRTAAFRAALAREIAGKLQPAKQAESFTIGLLQDMALPLLASARPDDYGKVLETWHEDGTRSLTQIEDDALGWNHAQVGELLARKWELPAEMVALIGLHHSSEATDAQVGPAIRLVALLRETEVEHGIDALVEEAKSGYGLDPDWMRAAVATCQEKAVELAEILT
jgi:HD-like signal output (HDOD) protein